MPSVALAAYTPRLGDSHADEDLEQEARGGGGACGPKAAVHLF